MFLRRAFSTGQTLEDIQGLMKLAMLSGHDASTLTVPPALRDPNYVPPRQSQRLLNGVTATSVTLVTLMMLIKVYVRSTQVQCLRQYSLDDYTLILAYFMFLSLSTMIFVGVNQFQWGYHVYDMKLKSLLFDYRLLYVYEVLFTLTLVTIRLSMLFLLRRLFRDTSRSFRILNDILIWVNLMFGVGATLASTFKCSDARAAWDIYVKFHLKCRPLHAYWLLSGFQLLLDLASVMLPVKLVSALSGLTLKKKIEVLIMFSLGSSACIAAIARCFYLQPVVDSLDLADAPVKLTVWCQVEATLALVAACVPAFRQLIGILERKSESSDIVGRISKTFRTATCSGTGSRQGSISLKSRSKSILGSERDSQSSNPPSKTIVKTTEQRKDDGLDLEAAMAVTHEEKRSPENEVDEEPKIPERLFNHHLQPIPYHGQQFEEGHGRHRTSRLIPSSSDLDFSTRSRTLSPPRSTPRLGLERPPLHMSASFETANSGVCSSANSMELSSWDTTELSQPAPLTPRPHFNSRNSE